MYGDPLHLVLVFDHYSFLADGVSPWFVYAVITLETAGLYAPNKVDILVTDAPVKHAPTICPLWKPDKSPILQYFNMNCY